MGRAASAGGGHVDIWSADFWSSDAGKLLLGALLGATLSLVSSVVVLHIQGQRERQRYLQEQGRAVLIEALTWWRREKVVFELEAAAVEALTREWRDSDEPIGRFAAQLQPLLKKLAERIPADIEQRLYWFGSQNAYRKIGEASTALGWLSIAARQEADRQMTDDIDRRFRGATERDLEKAASSREDQLRGADGTVKDAVMALDSLAFTLKVDSTQERRRLRGDAQLQSAAAKS